MNPGTSMQPSTRPPALLLQAGERVAAGLGAGEVRWRRSAADRTARPVRGEGADCGVLEEVDHGDVPAQGLGETAAQADEEERAAAELEEVVVDPHPLY